MILPDASLGVLGGGQLGRLFSLAARGMGYRVWVLDPDPHSPAGAVADQHLKAGYDDRESLATLARHCAAVTTEFENVPAETLAFLESRLPVRPCSAAVAIARDRIAEKTFIHEQGLATARFVAIREAAELEQACRSLPMPALLKTARLGYDGKGQVAVDTLDEARRGFEQLQGAACVLEERVELAQELSVILARSVDGESVYYPLAENVHRNGILDTSCVPARVPERIARKALDMAGALADAMDYCGVLAIEFFLAKDGRLLINEMAPRPHNSGHYTLDASLTSQFQQQVRTLCGLSPGAPDLLSPVVMVNLLGDLWRDGQPPPWERLLHHPRAKLHLYGKKHPKPGRKMGHYSCLAPDLEQAMAMAEQIRGELTY